MYMYMYLHVNMSKFTMHCFSIIPYRQEYWQGLKFGRLLARIPTAKSNNFCPFWSLKNKSSANISGYMVFIMLHIQNEHYV